jgi:hypothetical protein
MQEVPLRVSLLTHFSTLENYLPNSNQAVS